MSMSITGPRADIPVPPKPSLPAKAFEFARRMADVVSSVIPRHPAYLQSYPQLQQRLAALQQRYPNLVTVRDIGDTRDKVGGRADHDVLALTLTNKALAGPKPRFTSTAGIHAREIANPALLMDWAESLLAGYGTDAEATMLLDTREIDIVPMVNVDGHEHVVEGVHIGGGPSALQRRNGPLIGGVDLNRNFDWKWGSRGTSPIPIAPIYPGPRPASEPETQAVQGLLTQRKPNLFIDWHSSGRLVLHPPGDTKEPGPDHIGMQAVTRRIALINGYQPMQASSMYPTSGTADDWAWGRLGVPAFAIETGGAFLPTNGEYQASYRENAPVLNYAAKIADNPYLRAQAPDVASLVISRAAPGAAPVIEARAIGTGTTVAGAELVFDTAAPQGSGTPLAAVDGAFGGAVEALRAALPAAPDAAKMAYVRAQAADGTWGPLTPQWLSPPVTARQ